MVKYYYDYCGTYSITLHKDGTATLRCRTSQGKLWCNKVYKSEKRANQALARYCDGMPNARGGH